MNNATRIEIETQARALRRSEFSRLIKSAINAVSESMRRHHEAMLRQEQIKRVSAMIGTPA